MDEIHETLNRIFEGCKLARDLETTIRQVFPISPDYLLQSCEEIVTAFNAAMNSLNSLNAPLPVSSSMVTGGAGEGSSHGATTFFQALNLLQSGGFEQPSTVFDPTRLPMLGLEMPVSAVATSVMDLVGGSGCGNMLETTNTEVGGTRGRVRMAPECSSGPGSGTAGSSGQRSTRRRRDNGNQVIQRVPAVRTGDTEVPPDDGYTWRKYGQKDILSCRFPRSYFRCTHRNYYGCQARKQVQRLDEDPYTFEIVYCGQHSCLTSTTPLLISSLAMPNTGIASAVAPITATTATTTTTAIVSDVTTNPHIESSMIGATLAEMTPSTSIHLGSWVTRDLPESRPVTDMADVLFNSGSSGSSMDAIFSSRHEN